MDGGTATARLPFVPTLLCLFGAGFVSAAAGALWLTNSTLVQPGRSFSLALANAVLGAAVGAVVLRPLLVKVAEFEVAYPPAFLALAVGDAFSLLLRVALFHAVLPAASLVLGFGGSLVGAFVGYAILERFARPVAPQLDAGAASDVLAAQMAPADGYDASVRSACETALALTGRLERSEGAERDHALALGLPPLRDAVARLRAADPPAAELDAHTALVAALVQLEERLPRDETLEASDAVATIRTALRRLPD